MKVWQPIASVPLDTVVIVTDGRSRRLATLQSQKPVWKIDPENQNTNYASGLSQAGPTFSPTHWFALPKLPVKP
jgi:hypothetical protein